MIKAVRDLNEYLHIPATIKDAGVDEAVFLAGVDELADKAHSDQCTTANPRYPLVSELKDLYLKAYYGTADYPRK